MEVLPAAGQMTPRFTIDGSADLEARLAQLCERTQPGLSEILPASRLQGILLGGGYGRGEGGVLATQSGDKPYNDLEFYVLVKGSTLINRRRFGAALDALGERLSSDAGIEIEFKVLSVQKLRSSPPSMFYYDLVAGHRWILGDENLLAGCERHRRADLLPLSEASRLLMNRCSGLLFAEEKLANDTISAVDADFIFRNQAKAQLAFGDAVLAAEGQYHWSCRCRLMRIVELRKDWPWLAALQEHHQQGVAFKLRPRQESVSRKALQDRQQELKSFALRLWLWLEGRRLKQPFLSAQDYALSPADKFRESPRWRNILTNALSRRWHWRDPRERIYNALALLLWEPDVLTDAALLHHVQCELRTTAVSFPELVQSYRALWKRFN
jgi:hypothetical protein